MNALRKASWSGAIVDCTVRKYRNAASDPFTLSAEFAFVVVAGYTIRVEARASCGGGARFAWKRRAGVEIEVPVARTVFRKSYPTASRVKSSQNRPISCDAFLLTLLCFEICLGVVPELVLEQLRGAVEWDPRLSGDCVESCRHGE
jgi:hypothetical protein